MVEGEKGSAVSAVPTSHKDQRNGVEMDAWSVIYLPQKSCVIRSYRAHTRTG